MSTTEKLRVLCSNMPPQFFRNHIIFSIGLFTRNLENKWLKSPFICCTESIIECIAQEARVEYKHFTLENHTNNAS